MHLRRIYYSPLYISLYLLALNTFKKASNQCESSSVVSKQCDKKESKYIVTKTHKLQNKLFTQKKKDDPLCHKLGIFLFPSTIRQYADGKCDLSDDI